jgi:hypothetical protein
MANESPAHQLAQEHPVRSAQWLARDSALKVTIITLTVIAPIAEFFWARLHVRGRTVIQTLGMPWPDDISDVVQTASAILVIVTIALSIAGIVRGGRAGTAGIVACAVTFAAAFPVLVLTLILTFGDPGGAGAS